MRGIKGEQKVFLVHRVIFSLFLPVFAYYVVNQLVPSRYFFIKVKRMETTDLALHILLTRGSGRVPNTSCSTADGEIIIHHTETSDRPKFILEKGNEPKHTVREKNETSVKTRTESPTTDGMASTEQHHGVSLELHEGTKETA